MTAAYPAAKVAALAADYAAAPIPTGATRMSLATYRVAQALRILAGLLIVLAMMTECSKAADSAAAFDPSQNYLRLKFTDRTELWRPCRVTVDQYPWRTYVTAWCDFAAPESISWNDRIFQDALEPAGVIGPGPVWWEVHDAAAPAGSPPLTSGTGCRVLTAHLGTNTSAQLDCTP